MQFLTHIRPSRGANQLLFGECLFAECQFSKRNPGPIFALFFAMDFGLLCGINFPIRQRPRKSRNTRPRTTKVESDRPCSLTRALSIPARNTLTIEKGFISSPNLLQRESARHQTKPLASLDKRLARAGGSEDACYFYQTESSGEAGPPAFSSCHPPQSRTVATSFQTTGVPQVIASKNHQR